MAILLNTFESGTNGAVPDATNTTSPDAFNTFAATGLTFSNAFAQKGSLSLNVNVASSANSYISWQAAAGATTSFACRGYIYVPTLPVTNSQPIFNFRSSGGGSSLVQVQLDNTGGGSDFFVSSDANAGVRVAQTNVAISANTWYRVECWGTAPSTTTGTVSLRVYVGDSTTTFASVDATAVNIGAVAIGTFRVGRTAAIGSAFQCYIDDVAFQTGSTTPIGPSVAASVNLRNGAVAINNLMAGSTQVSKLYAGTVQVWP